MNWLLILRMMENSAFLAILNGRYTTNMRISCAQTTYACSLAIRLKATTSLTANTNIGTEKAQSIQSLTFFINAVITNGNDFNKPMQAADGLEIGINIVRTSSWGGFVNTASFIYNYTTKGVEKHILK